MFFDILSSDKMCFIEAITKNVYDLYMISRYCHDKEKPVNQIKDTGMTLNPMNHLFINLRLGRKAVKPAAFEIITMNHPTLLPIPENYLF